MFSINIFFFFQQNSDPFCDVLLTFATEKRNPKAAWHKSYVI